MTCHPTGPVDTAVLTTVTDLLDHRVIQRASSGRSYGRQVGQKQQIDRRTELERELKAVEARLGRLVAALVNGGPMETVVAQFKTEEGRQAGLVVECEALEAGSETSTTTRSARTSSSAQPTSGVLQPPDRSVRQMLRKLLDGKIPSSRSRSMAGVDSALQPPLPRAAATRGRAARR